MLTHIVCWKYKAETTEEEIETHIEKLRKLPEIIPHILSFKVGRDLLHLERSFDTGLVATFPSLEELNAYDEHPAHREVAALGRQIAERVASVDFVE